MEIPLQVTFRNMGHSDAIENNVRDKATKLERYYDRIVGCRVVVEADHRNHRKGNLFHVRIEVSTPGGLLVASREPHQHHAHTDAYVAIRDAFEAIRKQLDGHGQRRRREIKVHEIPPHGRVMEIDHDLGEGRIAAADGREFVFNSNAVTNSDFAKMIVGTEVRFAEAPGDEEPRASTVTVVGKHHIVG